MSALFETRCLDPHRPEDFELALRLLRQGALVAVPTETVYGLAADASNPEAVSRIFEAKGRPSNHPLIVHLADAQHMDAWARDIPEIAWRLAARFWPGPITLLLHKADAVSPVVTGGLDTIGLRVPAHPVMQRILSAFRGGLAAPSANRYQQLSPTAVWQVLKGLSGRIDAIVDGGPCSVGVESTIVDLTGPIPRIVRAGPITRAQLQDALHMPVEFPEEHDVAVPGNVAMHYRPKTPLHLFETETLRMRLRAKENDAPIIVIEHSNVLSGHDRGVVRSIQMPADKTEYARCLYDALHTADAGRASAIWMEMPPLCEDWRDVHDRLGRAASAESTPPDDAGA